MNNGRTGGTVGQTDDLFALVFHIHTQRLTVDPAVAMAEGRGKTGVGAGGRVGTRTTGGGGEGHTVAGGDGVVVKGAEAGGAQ